MRVALLVATATLVAGLVTWNVVFERAIESAQRRYLALPHERAGALTIRQVMDPAIPDAAAAATQWAAGASATVCLVAAGLVRVVRRRPAAKQAPTAP